MHQQPDPYSDGPQGPDQGPHPWDSPFQQHASGGYEAPLPVESPILTIGDISISQSTAVTPSGRIPLKGSIWTVTDMSRTEENIPAWAIVVAILFIWTCFLSLLFLLVKDRRTTGHVQVSVQGGGMYHSTAIPAHHPGTGPHIHQQVNYVRSLAA
ncbi:MAG TPA: hypothetical protein H9836_17000 [Candidatus Nocardiopsis merdipullorum]|nr:hypothetical protein [Candidatus Nocardiopsis merdipullorum]